MRQLQSTRIQGAHNTERLADGNVAHVFAANLGLEAVRHPGVVQALDTLGQGAFEDDIERELVVVGGQDFSLAFSSLAELPDFFEKDFFLVRLAATGGGARREVPTIDLAKQRERERYIYTTRATCRLKTASGVLCSAAPRDTAPGCRADGRWRLRARCRGRRHTGRRVY